ncbi:lysozyme family protein [Fictibacillus sp. KIGAM418]|uniref:Lysozyme family protein n=1 Tax=Fictibacillus marinisediminis TaxID=2878389 RepID=A0A9X2BGI4_9BACL|nr:lysozyme family protein [Fictibacillus marinisediminis]
MDVFGKQAQQLKKAKGDLKTAIQSYNLSDGFIDYVDQRGGHYTKELAINLI